MYSEAASTGYEKRIGDQLRQDPTLLVSDVLQHISAYMGVISTYLRK